MMVVITCTVIIVKLRDAESLIATVFQGFPYTANVDTSTDAGSDYRIGLAGAVLNSDTSVLPTELL